MEIKKFILKHYKYETTIKDNSKAMEDLERKLKNLENEKEVLKANLKNLNKQAFNHFFGKEARFKKISSIECYGNAYHINSHNPYWIGRQDVDNSEYDLYRVSEIKDVDFIKGYINNLCELEKKYQAEQSNLPVTEQNTNYHYLKEFEKGSKKWLIGDYSQEIFWKMLDKHLKSIYTVI